MRNSRTFPNNSPDARKYCGRMGWEDKMQVTDVLHNRLNSLVLTELASVKERPKESVIRGGQWLFESMKVDAIDLRLTHIATIEPAFWGDNNDYLGYRQHLSCGGELTFQPLPRKTHDVYKVKCSGKRCGLSVRFELLDFPEPQNLLLHLLIKQMVPGLPCANYVDCGHMGNKEFDSELPIVRSYGLFAHHGFALRGTQFSQGRFACAPDTFFDLALTAKTGLQTQEGFDGFDTWMQFLVSALYLSNKNYVQSTLLPLFSGPRSK